MHTKKVTLKIRGRNVQRWTVHGLKAGEQVNIYMGRGRVDFQPVLTYSYHDQLGNIRENSMQLTESQSEKIIALLDIIQELGLPF